MGGIDIGGNEYDVNVKSHNANLRVSCDCDHCKYPEKDHVGVWVSAINRLPQQSGYYVVFSDKPYPIMAYFCRDYDVDRHLFLETEYSRFQLFDDVKMNAKEPDYYNHRKVINGVTHWMPAPKLPNSK